MAISVNREASPGGGDPNFRVHPLKFEMSIGQDLDGRTQVTGRLKTPDGELLGVRSVGAMVLGRHEEVSGASDSLSIDTIHRLLLEQEA